MPEAGKKENNGTAAKTRKKVYNLKKKSLNEAGYDKTKNLKKVNK